MTQQSKYKMIYLDNAASTPTDSRVVEAMLPYFNTIYGNPSAIHPMGCHSSDALENARRQVAALINCHPEDIIFTSGGTEADNLALLGLTAASVTKGNHIITSQIEHHAILETCHHLEKKGIQITYLPVDRHGMVAPEAVRDAIRPDTVLVSVMAANNVIGTIQPITEIGAVCREKGVFFHTDAVQLVGHLPVDVEKSQIDLLSLSAHKFNGPKGVGALFARREVPLSPIIFGGGQEEALRSGTENVPGIVGLGMAAEIAGSEITSESARIHDLSLKLINGILNGIPGVRLNGHPENRLPNNINVSIPGIEGEYLTRELGKRGVCVSTGSACSSGTHEAPYVLLATGLERDLANCSIRLSLGKMSDEDSVRQTINILSDVCSRIRAQSVI
ncbi:cysteine desulfurase family protein [Dehalogenimonas sp. THU2]|uniref:cysteine desulfurase family protein n=1 Tax=Dehalogenimonas sp. THU2 TaxID=3151121 RepID=UPI0032186798